MAETYGGRAAAATWGEGMARHTTLMGVPSVCVSSSVSASEMRGVDHGNNRLRAFLRFVRVSSDRFRICLGSTKGSCQDGMPDMAPPIIKSVYDPKWS
ncbi:hypothetical protein BHM03_00002775 [Ensete ventricosum]|nr:hypothetical protein BHM03_00002775 [Ensete ventricosum]